MYETPWRVVELPSVRTSGKPGRLSIIELAKIAEGFFPNDAAPRVYLIDNDTPDWSARGGHQHPEGGKRELLVVLRGEIEFDLHSASACLRMTLSLPTRGLLLPNGVWHGVCLSPGALLLAVASTLYASDEARTEKPCLCP